MLLSPALLEAYRQTHFVVTSQPEVTIKIGHCNPALDDLLKRYGVSSAVFITACNPYSQELTEAENEDRMLDLRKHLEASSISFLSGVGRDPKGEWPGEPSYLALGVERDEAVVLARRFEQNAVVMVSVGGEPELVVCV